MTKLATLLKQHSKTIPKLYKELVRDGHEISQQTLYNAVSRGRMSLDTARILASHFNLPIGEIVF